MLKIKSITYNLQANNTLEKNVLPDVSQSLSRKLKNIFQLFVCKVILHAFCHLQILIKLTFPNKSVRNTIRVSQSLDPDLAQHFVGPDLGPHFLQVHTVCKGYQQATKVTTSKGQS